MAQSPNIAALAAHLADTARMQMLLALMDGRALTVSELGTVAGLGKASASEHLGRLLDAGLLRAERQGRHKYLALAGAPVARLIEQMMALAAATQALPHAPALRTGPKDPGLREARLCYNHLAGRLGVQIYRSLSARGCLAHAPGGLSLTDTGRAFALDFGLSPADLAPGRTPLCRDCLDWSERESHLGGRLGRLLLARIEAQGWLQRSPGSRALVVPPRGRAALDRLFPAEQGPRRGTPAGTARKAGLPA
jgi:DNA-binding transcriptional ArsR family regulator